MSDAILNVLNWINACMSNMSGKSNVLYWQFGNFQPGLYNYAKNVMNNVVMPVAYVILALFLLLELHKASLRMESAQMGTAGNVTLIFKVLIKCAICKIVLDETPNLLKAIYNATAEITRSINNLNSTTSISDGLDLTLIGSQIEDLNIITGIIPLLLSFVTFLIVWIATIMANVIIIIRFFELYLYVAIAPIPIATLPHEEFSQIGKNFLKSFTAVCVQGTLIFLVLTFFPVIYNSKFLLQRNAGQVVTMGTGEIYTALLAIVGYAIVLIIAIFSTNKWAKSICGAM